MTHKLLKLKRFSDICFVALFVLMSLFYYSDLIFSGPHSIHMWRQTDCLSITENFMSGGAFHEPELHILLADDKESGKSIGEFPLLYYFVGNIWSVTGKSYLIFRLILFLILFAGSFAFYKSILLLFKNRFWAVTLPLLLFTSPAFVFYGVSFLMDVPAFAMILIAHYFLVKYQLDNKPLLFFLSIMFFTLGGLLKVSVLITFVFLCFIFFLELFPVKTMGSKKFFRKPIMELSGLFFVILIVLSWYYYASTFSAAHGFKFTFNSIFPIYKVRDWDYFYNGFFGKMTYLFFSRTVLFLVTALGIFNLFLYKKLPLFAYFANFVVLLGCIMFFLLWTPLFDNHDYYYIPYLSFFVVAPIVSLWYTKTYHPTLWQSIYMKIAVSLFVVFNFLYCYDITMTRVKPERGIGFVKHKDLIKFLKWGYRNTEANCYIYERMKPYLLEIGIKPEDRLLMMSDKSFSISLYLSGHKGWTAFTNYKTEDQIEELINKGAKYMIVYRSSIEKKPFLQPFLKKRIGSFEKADIYEL